MTPIAFAKIFVIPNGLGGILGADIFVNEQRPHLWGSSIIIIPSVTLNECRFSFVDPILDAADWYKFDDPLISLVSGQLSSSGFSRPLK